MRILKSMLAVLFVMLFGVVSFVSAQSHLVSKKTVVTTSHPLEVPGAVLPAGTYAFKVVNTHGSQNVVRVTNEDGTEHITMFMAISNHRLTPTAESVLEFHDTPDGTPRAVRSWFFAHQNAGLEFVYPKQRAVELAQASKEIIPADAGALREADADSGKEIALIAITPQGKEAPVAEALATTPTNLTTQLVEPIEVAQALPETASSMPLIGLVGAMLVMGGLGVKQFVRQRP